MISACRFYNTECGIIFLNRIMNCLDGTESLPPGNEWHILKDVYDMLTAGKVLNTPNNEPIIRFKHPEELRVS